MSTEYNEMQTGIETNFRKFRIANKSTCVTNIPTTYANMFFFRKYEERVTPKS